MSITPIRPGSSRASGGFPLLEPGDHLDQPTFHARYQAMPEEEKIELIGGVVYMPAALRTPHGRYHALLMNWLGDYWVATPGTDLFDNATVILGPESEAQPDACLCIIGGRTREDADGYLTGPPELVVEICSTTESYDLHAKRDDYHRAGVQEYLALVLRTEAALWQVRESDGYRELPPEADGIHRARVFPGLWLDAHAFFRLDGHTVKQVLARGLETPEYRTFAAGLKKD